MLFGLLTRAKKARVVEEILFESGALPLAIATAVLRAAPDRERDLAAIRNLLAAIPKAEKEPFVDRVVHRFLLYVMDLPASEKNHHARPFGLLDHSLEVARMALERAQDQRFTMSHDPIVNHTMQPRWIYGVFVAALLHDIGKVTDVSVTAPSGGLWNPFREPLAAFYRREGLAPGDLSRVRHRVGRGLEGHVLHNPFFYSMILPLEARDYLGVVQSHLLHQQSEAYGLVKALASQADKLSASRDAAIHGVDFPGAERRDSSEVRGHALWHYFADAFRRGLEEGLLASGRLDSPVFFGERHVAIVYPGGIVSTIEMLRRIWDTRAPELRAYTADETGARKLLHDFAHHEWLFMDRESGAWSLDCAIVGAAGSRSTVGVLFPKDRLAPDAKPSPFTLSFSNRETHRAVAVADFFAKYADPHSADPAAGSEAEGSHTHSGDIKPIEPAPALPAAGAAQPPVPESQAKGPESSAPPVRAAAAPRSRALNESDLGLDAARILTDIQNALRTGILTVNGWRTDVYLTTTHAYIVLPEALDKVAGPRGYAVLPSDALNAYLNTLGRHPLVEHRPGGQVLMDVFTAPDALRPVHTFRVKIAGWLTNEDLKNCRLWDRPITEATAAERERRNTAMNAARFS